VARGTNKKKGRGFITEGKDAGKAFTQEKSFLRGVNLVKEECRWKVKRKRIGENVRSKCSLLKDNARITKEGGGGAGREKGVQFFQRVLYL